jgi:hypothetical protein
MRRESHSVAVDAPSRGKRFAQRFGNLLRVTRAATIAIAATPMLPMTFALNAMHVVAASDVLFQELRNPAGFVD